MSDEMQDVTLSFHTPGGTQRRSFHLPLSHLVYALSTMTSLARRNGPREARTAFTQLLDGARAEQSQQQRAMLAAIVDAEAGGFLGRLLLRRRRNRIVEAVMGTVYADINLMVDELGDASSRLYDMGRAVNRLQEHGAVPAQRRGN